MRRALLTILSLPIFLTACGQLPPEPPPTLTPKYELSKVLLVEELKSAGFRDFPSRFDSAMVASLKACSVDVYSYVAHEPKALTLSESDENKIAVQSIINEFMPKTLIIVHSISEIITDSVINYGAVQWTEIQVTVKDIGSGTIIRTLNLGSMGRDLSGNFGSIRGGLRWQILHNLQRDGLLSCDPGPTDGNRMGFGL